MIHIWAEYQYGDMLKVLMKGFDQTFGRVLSNFAAGLETINYNYCPLVSVWQLAKGSNICREMRSSKRSCCNSETHSKESFLQVLKHFSPTSSTSLRTDNFFPFFLFFFLLPVCHRQKTKKKKNGATLPLKNATENTSNFGRLLVGRLHNTSSSNLAQAMAKANRRHCGPRFNPI